MPVYIDDSRNRLNGLVMSHMIADSRAELLLMAEKLGLCPEWIQKAGTYQEHFDVCQSKKATAVRKFGAKAITKRELVSMLLKRRG